MASLTRRGAPTPKREAIEAGVLEATEALLEEGASFTELSVERIATRAGISRTSFYFYFRDKRELLMRLTEDVSDVLYRQADGWWSGAGDGAADLDRALREILGTYREHAALLRAVVETAAYDEPIGAFWRALMGRFIEATRARLERDELTGLPAEETAFVLVWMTERACYQQVVRERDVEDEALISAITGIWRQAVYG
jgi:AcrR family transcriptional regulator